MDQFVANEVLCWYERLERSVLEFGEGVPLTVENETLKAPILASILIDACSLLDSMFRDMTCDPVSVNGKTKTKKDCNIVDFAWLHSQSLDLPNTQSVMLVSPPRYRAPFEKWKSLNTSQGYVPLPWWQAYTDLKHDCLSNLDKATVGFTLDALCALNQIIARRLDMIRMVMRHGWFPSEGYDISFVLGEVNEGKLPDTFVIQTKIFAVPAGEPRGSSTATRQFPADLKDLKPHFFQCKKEFLEFFGSTG
jgi:hypothetical protein